MPPDLTPFLGLRRHVRVAHHTPGRIRLKLSGLSLSELRSFDPRPFAGFLDGIEAVRSVRVNRAALSAVVEYDAAQMTEADWSRLLEGSPQDVAAVLAKIGAGDTGKNRKGMQIDVQ